MYFLQLNNFCNFFLFILSWFWKPLILLALLNWKEEEKKTYNTTMKTKHAVLLWKCTFFFSLFLTYSSRIWISFYCSGDSANAVPPTKKLRTRVTNICGDRRGQPNRSAMERPHSGPTTLVIVVQPVPGKYARAMLYEALTFPKRVTEDLDSFHFPKGSASTEC